MLAVAAKKRLLLFHHDGNEFVELKELALPERRGRACLDGRKRLRRHQEGVRTASIYVESVRVDAGFRVRSRSSADHFISHQNRAWISTASAQLKLPIPGAPQCHVSLWFDDPSLYFIAFQMLQIFI